MNLETIKKIREYISSLNPGDHILANRLAQNLGISRPAVVRYLEWIHAVGLQFPKDQEIIIKYEKNQQGCKVRYFYKKK